MNIKSYNEIMHYLDLIEAELNKIAAIKGHPSFNEFIANK